MTHKILDADLTKPSDLLRDLSSQDFLNFGAQQIAYIRKVDVDGAEAFAVHDADGTPLSVMDTLDSAMVVARYNDLEPATVH